MKTKKLFKFLLLFFVLGVSMNSALAATFNTFYARMGASLSDSSPSGAGLVYVATVDEESAGTFEESSTNYKVVDEEGDGTAFTLYAKANHGFIFDSWNTPEGAGNPGFEDGYLSTQNPIVVHMNAATKSSYSDLQTSSALGNTFNDYSNDATIKANFIVNPETPFNVSFLTPIGTGTYAVSSDINYPEVTPGSSTIESYSLDVITLTATNTDEDYGFRRFYYYADDENQTTTIGALGDKVQTVALTAEMKHIGCEFVPAWNVNYVTPESNGIYTAQKEGTEIPVDDDPETVQKTYVDDNITLSATPNDGYAFFRYVGTDGSNIYTIGTIGLATQTTHIPQNTISVTAEFTNKPFIAANNAHSSLEDAIQATRQSDGSYSGVILQVLDYTVLEGYYTIPAGVTLLVPQYAQQVTPDLQIQRKDDKPQGSPASSPDFGLSTYLYPSTAFKVLTLSSGVTMEVYGDIEVGGTQNCYAEGSNGVGRPTGYTYGHLIMNSNSKIILNSGANMRAWGFVTGEGEIDARRGSTVSEQFQIYDFKGGSKTLALQGNEKGVFPMTQYFIQNVEVPVTYRPGSALWGFTAAVTVNARVKLIGVYGDAASMFLMDNEDDSEDTWVRKSYNASTDQQVYEVNNSAGLGNIELSLGGYSFNSSDYVLPLTNNMKIHLKNGELKMTQSTALLAGAEIEIDKKATVVLEEGKSLFLYDAEQWIEKPMIFSKAYGARIKYRPGGVPTEDIRGIKKDKIKDASINVHGRLELEGSLYTTASGANIFSSKEDAGTILFSSVAPSETSVVSLFSDSIYKDSQNKNQTRWFYWDYITDPALLTNDAGSAFGPFSETAGTAVGKSFCFVDIDEDGKGEWINLTNVSESGCDGRFAYDQNGVYYIKPQAYVPISSGMPEAENDQTYRDHYAGTDRIFIEINCQWWEVEAVNGQPNLFHCLHPQNDTYYYYDRDADAWVEKKFNVTFKNYDGTILTYQDKDYETKDHYELPYGAMPNWLSTNPTRPDDADTTYSFTGWYPALDTVKSDQVYIATYAKTPIKYTIIYKFDESYNDGAEIKREQLARNAVPTPPTTERDGYYLQWTPAISAVAGNQTYTAQWLSEQPTEYQITFYDYDGTTVLTQNSVNVGDEPTPPADPTGKPSTKDYTYVFDHWTPSVVSVSHDGPKSYTAVYTSTPRKYAVKFYQENGSTQIGETQQVAYGEMPNVPVYSKEATASKTYTLVWSPLVSAATQNQDYIATFTEQTRQYAVTWKNYDGTTIETNYVDYNDAAVYSGVTPTKPENETYVYTFNGWNETPAEQVTANVEYTAQFTETEKATSLEVTSANPQTPIANGVVQATTVTITPNGSVDLSATNTKLMADDLILESYGTTSGQIIAGANSQVAVTNAYFDLKAPIPTHKWYAIAVPWHVNAETGISVNGRALEFGKDFDILYYDGAARAANGANGSAWKYLEDTYGKGYRILQPGTLYMIGLMMDAPNGIRFKKTGGALLTTSTSVTAYGGNADAVHNGWNGIANPAVYHAYMNAGSNDKTYGANYGQVYDAEHNAYTSFDMEHRQLVVGQPIFVQVPTGKSIVVNRAEYAPSSAPVRRANAENRPVNFEVSLSATNTSFADKLIVRLDEDKEDTYIIGQDLAKMGVSSVVPQLWINRYDAKLCMNTQSLTNGVAEYPLSIYAPAAGDYTITNNQSPITNEDYTLYLTLDGQAIWNLSESPYTLTLNKGTATNYGLRISARAPQTATGTDEAIIDARGETKKVLINDKVYIIRGNEVYTVDGRKVK